jgi:hypothetical protein
MPISNGREESRHGEWLTPPRFACLLLGLVVASYPQVVLGLQTFVYRDFGVFTYPLAFSFREHFWRGELPLWNPLNCCGVPFLAQWMTQVLYPPALFYLLLPLSWSLGMFCLLHLFWGGFGMYLLARRWTGSCLAAGFAGIVFAFSGVMLSSLIWPATVAGLSWMPWVVWLTERAWRNGGRAVPLAAFAGALQMLSGGEESVFLTWTLLGVLCLADFCRGEMPRGKLVVRAGLVVLLIAGLSAAQLLPFFELVDYSRRQQGVFASTWPMPVSGWANFLVPLFQCRSYQGVFMQSNQMLINSYYVGVATVVLAAGALWPGRKHRYLWPMALLTVLCLVLALGEATPVYRWLAHHFAVVGLMRFPVKFVILPVFVLPLLAAFALSKMSASPDDQASRPRWGGICLAAVVAILVLTFWAGQSALPGADRQAIVFNGVMRAIYFAAIVAVWFCARKFPRPGVWVWQLALLLLVWLDLFQQMPLPATVNRGAYAPGLPRNWVAPQLGVARAQVSASAGAVLKQMALSDVTADYVGRRYGLLANCNLLDNVPKCDGFFPLYVSSYAALFYNFYRDDQPADGLLDFLGVSEKLDTLDGHMDWRPRTTFLPLLTAGQLPHFADGLDALQRLTNADFNPRHEVVLPAVARPFITVSNAAGIRLGPVAYADQKIEAQLDAPAPTLVVAAQTYYPEWRPYVDGQPVRLWPANYAFQAFEVPAGSHQIKLVYEDRQFRLGLAISLATLIFCVVLSVCCPRNSGSMCRETD